jgi:hypothetical protein
MEESEWINLPGPTAFWPDNYDLESFGFGLPPLNKAPLYLRALQIATIEPKEPKDFPLLLLSNKELVMMDCEGVKHLTNYIIN